MQGKEETKFSQILISIIVGSISTLVLCALLFVVLSVAVSFDLIHQNMMNGLCVFVCALTSFIGGRIAVSRGVWKIFPTAVMTGTVLCLFIVMVSLIGEPTLESNQWYILLAVFLGSSCAGLFSKRKRR
ncbi:MAG: TIGR04086 family membrane protein [Evtepia sp.]